MRRAYCLPVISLGAAAVGMLLGTARRPAAGPTEQEIAQVASEIDVGLRATAAGVSARAQTLAELPRLALAVATDRETVDDLTNDELAFQPRQGETIELAQIPRAGGPPVSLLRLPVGASIAVPLAPPGLHLVATGSTLRIASIVRVRPRERADEIDGALSVSWPIDLSRAAAQLDEIGAGARLETPTGAIALGRALDEQGGTAERSLIGPSGQPLRLVAPARTPASWRQGPMIASIWAGFAAILISALICRQASRASRREQFFDFEAPDPLSREWTPPPPPSPYPPERDIWADAGRRLPLPPPGRPGSFGDDDFTRRG